MERRKSVMYKSYAKQMTETDKAYLAGLIDGEGHVYLYFTKKDSIYQPRFRIRMTDEELIYHVLRISGAGHVCSYVPAQVKKDGTPKRRVFEWGVTRFTDVVTILEQLLPYVVGKKKQVELVLKAAVLKMQGVHDGKDMTELLTEIKKHYIK